MSNSMIDRLDEADLFLRNRVLAKSSLLNEYDIAIMLEIAETCNKTSELLGRAIIPPCKIGETVYMLVQKTHRKCVKTDGKTKIVKSQHTFIKTTRLTELNFFNVVKKYGKTVFYLNQKLKKHWSV